MIIRKSLLLTAIFTGSFISSFAQDSVLVLINKHPVIFGHTTFQMNTDDVLSIRIYTMNNDLLKRIKGINVYAYTNCKEREQYQSSAQSVLSKPFLKLIKAARKTKQYTEYSIKPATYKFCVGQDFDLTIEVNSVDIEKMRGYQTVYQFKL